MELRTDEEFIRNLAETHDRRTLRATLAERKGEDSPKARKDVEPIQHYFYFLADEAMDDRGFAERLYSTLDNIKSEAKGLKPVILPIMQILTTRYQFGVDAERREQEESLEENFEDLPGRLDLGRSEEVKNDLIETLRAERKEKSTNEMYC